MSPEDSLNLSSDTFVSDLRHLMALLGVSQKEIAESLGVRSAHINPYFKGKSDIHSAKLLQILEILGVDVHQLLKKRIEQVSGRKNSEVNKLALSLRRLNKSSRTSILRLMEQLTQ